MSTPDSLPSLHMMVLVASAASTAVDWPALRREAGERGAVISLGIVEGDRTVAIVPAAPAVDAPREVEVDRMPGSSSPEGWGHVIDDIFAVRAAIASLDRTRVVLFADAAAADALEHLLVGDPSVEIELRSRSAPPRPEPAASPTAAAAEAGQRGRDRTEMERILPLGSQWSKSVGGRLFGLRFDADGVTEWLAQAPADTWRGQWALTPGDDTGGLDTLRLEIRVGEYYSRLLWRGGSFVGKEFTTGEWAGVGLLEKAKGYYYGDARHADVKLTRA